jgi:hypothetical protein
MQSNDHNVPHSPQWNSHLPQPIRHICLPARALVPTGCAFNRHRFLPPKKYHWKKKSNQKRKRATAGDEIKERKAPQNQSTMQEANDTMNRSEILLLAYYCCSLPSACDRKQALSAFFWSGSVVAKSRGREREREREREAKQETRNPVLGCQVGQARCVAQDATPWAPSPRAASANEGHQWP